MYFNMFFCIFALCSLHMLHMLECFVPYPPLSCGGWFSASNEAALSFVLANLTLIWQILFLSVVKMLCASVFF